MANDTERTPAEELRSAAKTLREAASKATATPWHSALVWSPDAKATSAVYSHAHLTGTIASEVVASGRIRSGYGGIRNPHNAVWITLMSPAVAEPLVAILERAAKRWESLDRRGLPAGADYSVEHALAFAREINEAVKR